MTRVVLLLLLLLLLLLYCRSVKPAQIKRTSCLLAGSEPANMSPLHAPNRSSTCNYYLAICCCQLCVSRCESICILFYFSQQVQFSSKHRFHFSLVVSDFCVLVFPILYVNAYGFKSTVLIFLGVGVGGGVFYP